MRDLPMVIAALHQRPAKPAAVSFVLDRRCESQRTKVAFTRFDLSTYRLQITA
jgi:hypothetical protein